MQSIGQKISYKLVGVNSLGIAGRGTGSKVIPVIDLRLTFGILKIKKVIDIGRSNYEGSQP